MALAVVTGGSSGLGLAIAERLAAKGYELLLVARSEDRLREETTRLAPKSKADYLVADLAAPEGLAAVEEAVRRKKPDILVNNAGFGTHGRFDEQTNEEEDAEIDVNIRAVMRLCRAALPAMRERRSGHILNVASTAALQPVPFLATYAATKAFILSFSAALAGEMKDFGVNVTALCPGPMETEFQQRAGMTRENYGLLLWESVDKVADQAVQTLEKPEPVVFGSLAGSAMAFGARFLPRSAITAMGAHTFKPR